MNAFQTFLLLFATAFLLNHKLCAQEEELKHEIFQIVEELPSYAGGDEARIQFIKNNLIYPEEAKEKGIKGTVYVTFIIEMDGSLSNIKILRGIGGGCDEEVIRIVKLMPKWNPGKQKGTPVRVQHNMPVKFWTDSNVVKDELILETEEPNDITDEEIILVIETSPTFIGGEKARVKFLKNNVKYPEKAKKNGIQGTVYVSFVVEKDGNISNVKILRGIGGGCDEEVIRVMKLMPKWNPGKHKGKAVRVQFTMTVKFILDDKKKKKKKRKTKKL